MAATDRIILVIDDEPERARPLKDMIEFMDSPEVRIVSTNGWRHDLGEARLAAVFLSDAISEATTRTLIGEIGALDPNVPIVILRGEDADD